VHPVAFPMNSSAALATNLFRPAIYSVLHENLPTGRHRSPALQVPATCSTPSGGFSLTSNMFLSQLAVHSTGDGTRMAPRSSTEMTPPTPQWPGATIEIFSST
jgi:hypothetical protein